MKTKSMRIIPNDVSTLVYSGDYFSRLLHFQSSRDVTHMYTCLQFRIYFNRINTLQNHIVSLCFVAYIV